MSDIKLDACPFCLCHSGCPEMDIMDDDIPWTIYCSNCEAEGPPSSTESGAAEAWNNREERA